MSGGGSYYVYALKDPLVSPAQPFYIGKGTGVRAWEHELSPDHSSKSERIQKIIDAGQEVLVVKLVESLTEIAALRIEAELIAAFGVEHNGGSLRNAVLPTTSPKERHGRNVSVPGGVYEKAQLGLRLLKSATLELACANSAGITNSEVAHALGLQSDYLGGSEDYLSWSLLGLLMREGQMLRVEKKRHKAQVR